MRISFLRPIDQFAGKDRLLERLRQHLSDSGLSHMRLVVAYAKIGPLLRLQSLFDAWSRQGKTVEAIFGIDQRGTSMQALEFAVKHFTRTYICHTLADSTFHAKFYLFSGDRLAICIYGSHNMTVGGTETNLESGTQLEISRPGEETLFQ